jgi:hypothetical protein
MNINLSEVVAAVVAMAQRPPQPPEAAEREVARSF